MGDYPDYVNEGKICPLRVPPSLGPKVLNCKTVGIMS